MTRVISNNCDLCGHDAFERLASDSARSMRSDQVIEARPLVKRLCLRCGLLRGEASSEDDLRAMYEDHYATAAVDHVFHTPQGRLLRSEAFADWLPSAFGSEPWRQATRVLEVGAGGGAVLRAFQRRFPTCRFEGLELSRADAEFAREVGSEVFSAAVEDWREGPYDVIYSLAVLEHVPSPTRYLRQLRRLLRPGGVLYLAQPTQDVPGYDVLFNDHLHHFGTLHLEAYARKTGFRELGAVVGCEVMPLFSAHCWQIDDSSASEFEWSGPPGRTTVRESFTSLRDSFAALDDKLDAWRGAGRTVAVFGLNEIFSLAATYSRLTDGPLRCGLDDDADKPKRQARPFPIVKPEQARSSGADAVVLAMNRQWLPRATERMRALGLESFPVLSRAG